jgi:hypothetical protein
VLTELIFCAAGRNFFNNSAIVNMAHTNGDTCSDSGIELICLTGSWAFFIMFVLIYDFPTMTSQTHTADKLERSF